MQPTHFRAYAASTTLSQRLIPVPQSGGGPAEQKAKVEHEVHDPVAEGALKDGVAAFSAKVDVAYVAFYAGELDEQVCLGRLDGPFAAGKISAAFADIPAEPGAEIAEGEVLVAGNTYRKID